MHNVCNVPFETKNPKIFHLWSLGTELEKSLMFISCLVSNSKPLIRSILHRGKDKHFIKDQGINANTNNNLNYLIAGLHPDFLQYIFIFYIHM